MGKVPPKEKGRMRTKQRRQLQRSSSKYLKPGAPAQLRCNKSSTAKSCTDIAKKRVLHYKKTENSVVSDDNMYDRSPLILSPVNMVKQNNLLGTPKTPRIENCQSDSRLESLPMDLLVNILCHLHHDQLRAVFHVSQRIRKAVLIARQFHFNYTTPDRSRREMLCTMTPPPSEHWPFLSKGIGIPHTPKAPRHGPQPPSRLKASEMRQVAVVLFQESTFPSRCMMPSVLPKPLCKTLASNRVLFYEDELCQAVAQNKLR